MRQFSCRESYFTVRSTQIHGKTSKQFLTFLHDFVLSVRQNSPHVITELPHSFAWVCIVQVLEVERKSKESGRKEKIARNTHQSSVYVCIPTSPETMNRTFTKQHTHIYSTLHPL